VAAYSNGNPRYLARGRRDTLRSRSLPLYRDEARMGLHQDRDEEDFTVPVVSISLGDTAVFRFGGTTRGGKTQTIKLASGDVLAMGGPARLCFHGIDRLLPGTSTLIEGGGRINLTLRRVARAV
jgi:alkylated DNA repair protein (DNA oxidative demethylase)